MHGQQAGQGCLEFSAINDRVNEAVVAQVFGGLEALRQLFAECLLDHPAAGVERLWIIDDGWKLIMPKPGAGGTGLEIYHLRDDPWEKTELSASQPGKVKELSARLEQWWSTTAAEPEGK